jgi:cytochrome c1
MRLRAPIFAVLAVSLWMALAGCNAGEATRPYLVSTGGNAEHGKQLMTSYGCGACHIVPGIPGARGLVGPPLLYFSQRTTVAGELPNTPENLARWIQHPKSVEPKTAMPDLGLSIEQANDIAAYLYTLPGPEGKKWTE